MIVLPDLRIDQYCSLLLLCVCLLMPVATPVAAEQPAITPSVRYEQMPLVPVVSSAERDEANLMLASMSARAVLVVDTQSESVLMAKEPHLQLPPASTTKIMTALVARREYYLDEIVTVREEIFTYGNKLDLVLGEQFNVLSALKGLLISSGNDIALLLANHHPGGYSGFVQEMNGVSSDLYLIDSRWSNPSGLDEEGHITTAFDLSILAQELMQDQVLRQIVGTKSETITDISGRYRHPLQNTHQLLGSVDGVVGIKTGTTELAREALVTQLERDQHSILIVVLNSQDRYTETQLIIDWVMQHYQWKTAESFIQAL